MARSIRQLLGTGVFSYIPPGGSQGQSLVKKTNIDYDVEWRLAEGSGGGGSLSYATAAELPLSGNNEGTLAFVAETNRLYVWNGVGWFNIALINTNPTITQGPNPSYVFATDGTPIVITLLATDPEGIPITWSFQVTSGTLGDTATISQDDNVFTITPSTSDEDVGSFGVTFTASDGVNIATAASSFTLVFAAADQFYNQSVVLTTSSVNNGNNNVFVDSSTNNFAITRNGNTTQGTFSPYSPARWSGFFDGTGDYLDIPSNAAFGYGTGDFTIEFWGYFTSFGSTPNLIDQRAGISAQSVPTLYLNGGALTYYVNGGNRIAGATLVTNRWYHIALCRGAGSTRIFVDGVQTGSTLSDTTNYIDSPVRIFASRDSNAVQAQAGHCSNVRIVKGSALYTANFAPPTEPLTAVANTSLLTLQDNRFVDQSSNNFAITRVGDTIITAFSPFIPQTPYSPSVHGGSAYFDGTGDFLQGPTGSTAFDFSGSGDFTVEMWINPINGTAQQGLITFFRDGSLGAWEGWTIDINNNKLSILGYSGGTNTLSTQLSTTTISNNAWSHVSVVRRSSVIYYYINGIQDATTINTSPTSIGMNAECILQVGAWNFTTARRFFSGHISNARIIKGTALYTANFTPLTAPVTAVANTSLLLNFTNANIFDETGKIVVETVGDASVSTSVIKYGDGSLSVTPTTSYARSPFTENFRFGTGDFTVECWLYLTTNAAGICAVWSNYSVFTTGALSLFAGHTSASTNLFHIAHNGTFPALTSTTTVNSRVGLWTHLAVVRNSGQIRLYINGVSEGAPFSSTAVLNGVGNYFWVGSTGDSPSAIPNGYISDLRITKGHARYTANFTPPTEKLGYNNAE